MGFEDLMRDRSAAQYADFVLPAIGRGDRVLDVGCGPGSITLGLAQAAGHVTGIDVDDAEFAMRAPTPRVTASTTSSSARAASTTWASRRDRSTSAPSSRSWRR